MTGTYQDLNRPMWRALLYALIQLFVITAVVAL